MEDLDALLADLQNTAAGSTGRPLYSPTVNGVNGDNVESPSGSPPPLPPPPTSYSPTLSPKVKSGPDEQRAQLNANISELDNLLGDLEGGARLNRASHADNRSTGSGSSSRNSVQTNGDTNQKAADSLFQQSNVLSTKVEALLDELDSAVAPTPPPVAPKPAVSTRPIPPKSNDLIIDSSGSPKTASSATKELDELMASLSDFKVNVQRDAREASFSGEAKPDSGARNADYAKVDKHIASKGAKAQPAGRTNQLDSMLGNLQSDMSRQGVTTVTKGTCAACKKPIVGQVCTALGRIWHPEHFTCAVCETPLGQKTFFERDGKPFCEEDYHEQFAPKCGYCEGPILDACVTAMDQTWHPEHFVCFQCGKAFGETGYHEKDGKPYCRDDYYGLFAPKCSGCNRAIMDNYISALNGHWHPQCFVCMECHQPFHGGSFFEHEGMPYCEMHYHARRGSLCYSCQKPITGRCITAMHRKFHPEHFICAFCLKQLNKGTFKEMNDKPYCHPCFVKLFG